MDSLIWNMCVLCWHFFYSWNFLNSDIVLEARSVCVVWLLEMSLFSEEY